jgi:hypothetical protein
MHFNHTKEYINTLDVIHVLIQELEGEDEDTKDEEDVEGL